ncbi:MAG: hypothetical protein JW942_05600 [Opitutales bacterium]|nr:hypothetical protein [Opitutales bacterium]
MHTLNPYEKVGRQLNSLPYAVRKIAMINERHSVLRYADIDWHIREKFFTHFYLKATSNNWFRSENEDLRMDDKASEVSSI